MEKNESDKDMELIRGCDNCHDQFEFKNVKKRFSSVGQEQLRQIWISTDVEFYCTPCYFLKLIGHLKDTKPKRGVRKEDLST